MSVAAAAAHQKAKSLAPIPVRSTRPLFKAQQIYLELRRKISDLELAPGTMLDRAAIGRAHCVSRTPVSEAIARLVGERLVEIHHLGSFVTPICASHVREALFIRMALEVETCGRAATLISDASIERQRANLAEQYSALERGDHILFADLDDELHAIMFDAVACQRAKHVVGAAVAAIARIRRLRPPSPDRLQKALSEHCWIVDAMATRNPDFAAAAMRAHLGNDGADIEQSLEDILREEQLRPGATA